MTHQIEIKQKEMLIINPGQVADLISRCNSTDNTIECAAEIRQMMEIKEALLWRADAAASCIGTGISMCLDTEVQTLKNALTAIIRAISPVQFHCSTNIRN